MKEEEKKKLEGALKIVNAAISREYERFAKIANTEEGDPIMLEGETSTGHYCQLMADPKVVAKIMLDYEYPTWSVLGEDAPEDMWNELGHRFGLATVTGADI